MLRPGGILGVVDFYVSRAGSRRRGCARHGALTRVVLAALVRPRRGPPPTRPTCPPCAACCRTIGCCEERRGPSPTCRACGSPTTSSSAARPATARRGVTECRSVRSIFLSDIHLGTRACQAERLLDFLREYESEHLFLVGDIVDFWAMSRGIYWSAAQNTVVQKILKRARHGVRVVFIPGNHDEALREYVGTSLRRHPGGRRSTSTRPPTAGATCCCTATSSTR